MFSQGLLSLEGPVQLFPPFAGAGLAHRRTRTSTPVPHVTEQVPLSIHGVHTPWTMLVSVNRTKEGQRDRV